MSKKSKIPEVSEMWFHDYDYQNMCRESGGFDGFMKVFMKEKRFTYVQELEFGFEGPPPITEIGDRVKSRKGEGKISLDESKGQITFEKHVLKVESYTGGKVVEEVEEVEARTFSFDEEKNLCEEVNIVWWYMKPMN